MTNFGMKNLFVVSRQKLDEENLSKATLFAAHGRWLIDRLEYVSSLEKLKRKYKILIGTTAIEGRRKSNITRKTMGIEECASMVVSRLRSHSNACFVFGRDTTGLTNQELRACDYTATIRTRSQYNTLNVSHAATIIFYVFSNTKTHSGLCKESRQTQTNWTGSTTLATRKERERVVLLFQKLAEESEFKEFKSKLLQETLERMFNRGEPSLRELYLLMGLASKATSKVRRLSKRAS
jgi:tRNA/rRNA methyltransferase